MAASSQLAARLQCQCSPLSGAAFATDTRASLQGRSLRCSVLARSATTLKLACKLQSSVWGHHIVSESTPVLRRAKGQSDIAPALRATALPSDLIGPQSNRWGAGLKQPLSSQKQNSAQSTNSKSRGVIKNGHTLNGAMRRSAIARLSPAAVHTTSASSSTLSENKLTPAGASPHTASKAGAPGAVHITTQKRSFQGVNVPSWADPGVQTSTLGIPSRTDFQSWKPPTSLGGLWEMVDLEAIGGVSAVPQWAGQTAYTAARMAFFFAQVGTLRDFLCQSAVST